MKILRELQDDRAALDALPLHLRDRALDVAKNVTVYEKEPGIGMMGFDLLSRLMKDRIVFVGEHEIGVFKEKGEYFAYSNFCLHQGGPACEGLTIAKVEERIMPDKTSRGMYFSDTELHFVCPWHGMEYDMKTGECISDRKMKLKKYQVLEKGDEVYVVA